VAPFVVSAAPPMGGGLHQSGQTIIEVAARNFVLKGLGRHTAREFAARLDDEIARRRGIAVPTERERTS